MNEVVVENISYDPYFILGCTPDDEEVFINKSFKKKAKVWHPDRLSVEDKKNKIIYEKQQHLFKVLVDSYEYVIDKRMRFTNKNRVNIDVVRQDDINKNNFNEQFTKKKVAIPNDYGYDVERISKVEEYENSFTPIKLFDKFNKTDFNKAFEYTQQQTPTISDEVGLYHKTNDGFSGYNSGDLGGAACVSSYNGLMIVGDNFGESGVGYYGNGYSDYKLSFGMTKNPNELNIPNDFVQSNKSNVPLTEKESKKQLDLQMKYRNAFNENVGSGSKADFNIQEQLFLEKQQQEMKNKIQNDKEFIIQYKDMYDSQTITQALNNNLVTSADFCNNENVDKRVLRSNFK